MIRSLLVSSGGALLDLLLPPACSLCAGLLDHPATPVCEECQAQFEPLPSPVCDRCGQPYTGGLCDDCRAEEPPLAMIRSALVYGGMAEQAVLKLKLRGKVALGPYLASWIANTAAVAALDLERTDLLVPVPLHRKKLAARGFNQSALIGSALSRRLAVPLDLFHLIRIRSTLSQATMRSKAERRQNLRNAFDVTRRHPFAGKRICLVDDVVTTGGTLAACARALLAAGARSVVAITAARSVLSRA